MLKFIKSNPVAVGFVCVLILLVVVGIVLSN